VIGEEPFDIGDIKPAAATRSHVKSAEEALDATTAKKVAAAIKGSESSRSASRNSGEQVRVSSPSKDDPPGSNDAFALARLGVELKFGNYRGKVDSSRSAATRIQSTLSANLGDLAHCGGEYTAI